MQVTCLPELARLKIKLQTEPLGQRVVLTHSQRQGLCSWKRQNRVVCVNVFDHKVIAVNAGVVPNVVAEDDVGQNAKHVVSFRVCTCEKNVCLQALRDFCDAAEPQPRRQALKYPE